MWTEPKSSLLNRRDWLRHAGGGLGGLALASLLSRDGWLQAAESPALVNPQAPRPPHFPARAKAVIYLFMHGGPSHVDTFDPKPALNKYDGQPPPEEFHQLKLQFTDVKKQKLMGSPQTFTRSGRSGIEICDSLPQLQQCADDLCIVRSMHHEVFNHTPAIWLANTGSSLPGRASLGAWLSYGLGSTADNLPAFVVMHSRPLKPGPGVWGNGFLPAVYQGTRVSTGPTPIPHLSPPTELRGGNQRAMLDYLQDLNRNHAARRADTQLDARIASYELAFRMQSAAPEAVDLNRESDATRSLYGKGFGEQCLVARRLVQRGVRCVQLYHGGDNEDWDTHGDNFNGQNRRMREVDQGCAALLKDLRRLGMLEDTIVVWTGEFGRTPTTEGKNGRDHSPYGYSMWLAGGGIRGGQVYGGTDELGFRPVDRPVHLHDLNATLLHQFGLNHERLTWRQEGRDFRLTDVFGNVVTGLLA
ncbi:MAG: DUF1501 domain-containing protein [Proteobacteria bacterium]|nr:DUF1501 domain-containing protein [Pseudomonadota bacterium]